MTSAIKKHIVKAAWGERSLLISVTFWLLMIALVPLILLSTIGYKLAQHGLKEEIYTNMQETSEMTLNFLQTWFDARKIDIDQYAQSVTVNALFDDVQGTLEKMQSDNATVLKSQLWRDILAEKNQPVKRLVGQYDYLDDLYLIDVEGNILLDAKLGGDIGQNLYEGELASTLLSSAVKSALISQEAQFSDLEHYVYADQEVVGFLAKRLLDDTGQVKGAVVIQINMNQVLEILEYQQRNHKQRYLLGADGFVRAGTEPSLVLTKSVGIPDPSQFKDRRTVKGVEGRNVYAVFHVLNVLGETWLLVSEVDQKFALASSYRLAAAMVMFSTFCLLLVFFIAVFLAKRITLPLQFLTMKVGSIASNGIFEKIHVKGGKEITQLGDAFNKLVDQRKRYEEELSQTSAFLESIMHAASGVSIISTNKEGVITSFNLGAQKLLGYSPVDVIGMQTPAILHDPDEVAKRGEELTHQLGRPIEGFETFIALLEEQNSESREWTYIAKDGTRHEVMLTITPMYSLDDQLEGYLKIAQNISAVKQAEVALQSSKKQLEQVIGSTGVGIWDWDISEAEVKINQRWAEIIGYTPDEIMPLSYENWLRICHPEDREKIEFQIQKHWCGDNERYEAECRLKHRDGHYVWVFDSGTVIDWDVHGKPRRMVGTRLDITKRRKIDQELTKLSRIASQTSNGVIVADPKGYIEWVNDAFTAMSGFELEEVKGRKPGDVLQGPDTDQETVKYISKSLKESSSFQAEILNYHKNGTPFWVDIACNALTDEYGDVQAIIAVETNVTQQKQSMLKLAQQQAAMEEMSHQSRIGAWEFNLKEEVVYWSHMTREIFGVDDEFQADMNTMIEFVKVGEQRDQLKVVMQQAVNDGKPWEMEIITSNIHGEEQWVFMTGRPVMEAGECVRLYGSFQDIDERKRNQIAVQDILRHSQGLADLTLDSDILAGNLQQAKRKIVEKMTHALQAARASIWLFNLDCSEMECIDLYDRQAQTHSQGFVLTRKDHGKYFETMFKNSIVNASDAQSDPVTESFVEGYLKPLGITALLDAVIAGGSGIVGVVCFEDTAERREWTKAEESFAASIATLVGSVYAAEQRRLTEKELIEAKDAAETAVRAKSEFLAMMSHEIRTPMNGVLGMLNMLKKGELDKQQNRQANIAYSSANSLLHLLNDILDFSKIDAGKLQVEKINFDLRLMLKDVVDSFHVKAEEKSLFLNLELKELQERYAVGDPGRLRQVLTNLIGNAIKFTSEGGVTIRCKSESDRAGIRFSAEVIDTGIGIPQEKHRYLFDSFTQVDASTTRKYGGTGLGLAITKKLCLLMGGNIYIQSEADKGSNFSFDVQLGVADQQNIPSSGSDIAVEKDSEDVHLAVLQPRVGEGGEIHALVAEDNEINQEVIGYVLDDFGIPFDIANNGVEAIDLLSHSGEKRYTIILMDCQMPEMDGFETTRSIRRGDAGEHYLNIPIIALTANAMKGDRERCLESGMNDYLSKPVKESLLYEKLKTWQGEAFIQAPAGDEAASTEAEQEKTQEESSDESRQVEQQGMVWNRERAMERVKNKTERMDRLIKMFLNDMPERVDALATAVKEVDFEQVTYYAHAVKGVSANISAERLYNACFALEEAAKQKQEAQIPALHDTFASCYQEAFEVFEQYIG